MIRSLTRLEARKPLRMLLAVLAIAAAAVGMAGREGDLFRRVLGWSLLLLAVMVLIVVLQSTSVLGWMVI